MTATVSEETKAPQAGGVGRIARITGPVVDVVGLEDGLLDFGLGRGAVDVVESTHGLIAAGDMHRADELLGYPFTMAGEVVHGDKVGRTLGFPTVNVVPDEHERFGNRT